MEIAEILLDTSGSMAGGKQTFAKKILAETINPKLVGKKVWIRTFCGNKGLEMKLVNHSENAKLEDLNKYTNSINYAGGGTPISAALEKVIENLKQYPTHSKTIVLVTDGEEDSGGDYKTVILKAKQNNVDCAVHIVGIDLKASAQEKAELITKQSGGIFINVNSSTGKIIVPETKTLNKANIYPPQVTTVINKNPTIQQAKSTPAQVTQDNVSKNLDKSLKPIIQKLNSTPPPQKKEINIDNNNIDNSGIDSLLAKIDVSKEETILLIEEITRLRQLLNKFSELSVLDNYNITVSGDKEYTEKIRRKSEKYLWKILKKHYHGRVNWVNQSKESGLPYDFEITNADKTVEFFIDCKGTAYQKRTFYMTFNEWEHYLNNKDKYQIYRVFNVLDESQTNHIKIDNIGNWLLNGQLLPYLHKTETIMGGRVVLTVAEKFV